MPTIRRYLLTAWMVLSPLVKTVRLLLAVLTLPLRSQLSMQLGSSPCATD